LVIDEDPLACSRDLGVGDAWSRASRVRSGDANGSVRLRVPSIRINSPSYRSAIAPQAGMLSLPESKVPLLVSNFSEACEPTYIDKDPKKSQ
jgi:hypothetical protein